MVEESIVRRGEKIASTYGCEKMCLMAIENSGNHLVGERVVNHKTSLGYW